jgi:ubiquinol-cytochrome c reductase cytochrome c1 subunit
MNPMKTVRTLLAVAAFAASSATAIAADDHVKLDRAPVNLEDTASLQRGAKLFVNYCLNCHSAQYMRYNRLTDLGLTEDQIKANLMFASDKIGDTMQVALKPKDAAKWFGAQPPDLSVTARSRGADWLYTYLRTFYRDESRPTGWNNVAYPNVGMPNVLWELQGTQEMHKPEAAHAEGEGGEKAEAGHAAAAHGSPKLVLAAPGALTPKQYDQAIADLVNYLVYMGEPAQTKRAQIGIVTLLFLSVAFVFAYLVKREYWKDIH